MATAREGRAMIIKDIDIIYSRYNNLPEKKEKNFCRHCDAMGFIPQEDGPCKYCGGTGKLLRVIK